MPIILSKKTDMKKVIKKVNEERVPIIIVDDTGMSAVIMSFEDFESMNETIYLLSSKANAKWIYESIKDLEECKLKTFTLEELEKMTQ